MIAVRTVIVGEPPSAFEDFLERRRALGQDLYDEVWDGEYHVAPAPAFRHGRLQAELLRRLWPRAEAVGLVDPGPFTLGGPGDYRVPDAGFHRGDPDSVYLPTAAVVVEVVSPGDETYDKLGFYADHGVDEVIVADLGERMVRIWQLVGGRLEESGRSGLLGVTADELIAGIDWP